MSTNRNGSRPCFVFLFKAYYAFGGAVVNVQYFQSDPISGHYAINANIRMLINRGRGYKNMRYLLLKAKRMAVTNTEFVAFRKTAKAA